MPTGACSNRPIRGSGHCRSRSHCCSRSVSSRTGASNGRFRTWLWAPWGWLGHGAAGSLWTGGMSRSTGWRLMRFPAFYLQALLIVGLGDHLGPASGTYRFDLAPAGRPDLGLGRVISVSVGSVHPGSGHHGRGVCRDGNRPDGSGDLGIRSDCTRPPDSHLSSDTARGVRDQLSHFVGDGKLAGHDSPGGHRHDLDLALVTLQTFNWSMRG